MKTLSQILLTAVLMGGAVTTQAFIVPKAVVQNFETEDRRVSGFNAVEASGFFDVQITQGGREAVRVEAPKDVMNRIETVVEGGTLKLRVKRKNHGWNWSWNDNGHVIVYVSARNLNRVNLTGSGSVKFTNGLKGNDLQLSASGSGEMSGRVETSSLDSKVSGSGEMKLSGRADKTNVSISGSGDYSAASLNTNYTEIRVSGSGSAHINVNTRIDATVTGSGDIYYSGSARQVSTSKHGSGEIHRI